MKNRAAVLVLSAFALLLYFASCKKSNDNSKPVNPASVMSGVWTMHGTHEYLAHGITYTIDTKVTIWIPDSSRMVVYSDLDFFGGYSTGPLPKDSSSFYVFYPFSYNVKTDSLQYYMFFPESGNYQIISMHSVSHTPFANTTITTNTAKMIGTKQWHGTLRTVYSPPWSSGLPDVDTTYYDPITMGITALSDTLIMGEIYYDGTSEVWKYLFLRKTFEDPSTMVFTDARNPFKRITYYFANNSMFYFDSSYSLYPTVYKYYTP